MQEIFIKCDGYSLSGVLHNAKTKSAKAIIIMSHGFRGSKDGGGRARILAQEAAQYFNVIRYDFTPLSTLTRQKYELNAVIAYARANFAGPIILLGRSMGGCVSLLSAADDDSIKALILWSMPFHTQETFTLALGENSIVEFTAGRAITLDDEWGKAVLKPEFYNDLLAHDMKQALKKVKIPILFVHGEYDEIVPLAQAEEAFALYEGDKNFSLVKGGDHRFINGFEQAQKAVLDYLKQLF